MTPPTIRDAVPADIAAITAIYRPERNQIDVEIARKRAAGDATGDDLWLSVIVYNVDQKTIKKSVLALAKKAASRL